MLGGDNNRGGHSQKPWGQHKSKIRKTEKETEGDEKRQRREERARETKESVGEEEQQQKRQRVWDFGKSCDYVSPGACTTFGNLQTIYCFNSTITVNEYAQHWRHLNTVCEYVHPAGYFYKSSLIISDRSFCAASSSRTTAACRHLGPWSAIKAKWPPTVGRARHRTGRPGSLPWADVAT